MHVLGYFVKIAFEFVDVSELVLELLVLDQQAYDPVRHLAQQTRIDVALQQHVHDHQNEFRFGFLRYQIALNRVEHQVELQLVSPEVGLPA